MFTRFHLIVIADEDPAVSESIKFLLEVDGLQAHACGDGIELLSYPRLVEAACVVIDGRTRPIDGFEVAARLWARHPLMPVVFTTTDATAGLRRRASIAGVRCVLEKPFLGDVLLESIRGVMRFSDRKAS